jgi:hypothetical protein
MNLSMVTVALVAVGIVGLASRLLARMGPRVPRPDFDGSFVPGTTPVAVAVSNHLPSKDLNIVIRRRATLKPNDVILIRPSALQPELLAQAVETLRTTRREFGRLPNGDALIGVPRPGVNTPPRAAEAVGWVASLRRSKPIDLPGVGSVPLILLHLFDREIANNP